MSVGMAWVINSIIMFISGIAVGLIINEEVAGVITKI